MERIKWNKETNSNILCYILFSHSISNSNFEFCPTSHPNWNSVICVNYARKKNSKTKRVHVYIIFQMSPCLLVFFLQFEIFCQQNTVTAISSMIQSAKFNHFQVNFFYFFFFSVSSNRRHFCYLIFFKINCCYVFFVLFIVLREFKVFYCTKKKKKSTKHWTIFPVYVSLSIRSASLKW